MKQNDNHDKKTLWVGKRENEGKEAKNNVCLYPGEGKFKLPKGTQEVASLFKVWSTTLKNLGYFGYLNKKGLIFLGSLTNIKVL